MTQIFTDDGKWIPVTVIQAGPCRVVQVKTSAKDGYEAVQLGFEEKKPKRVSKPLLGQFTKRELKPSAFLREFRVAKTDGYKVGQEVKVDALKDVKWVDVIGLTRGRGFQGVVKRHGFAGGPNTHGSMTHRRPGSISANSNPARVFKNLRMAGHMGNATKTAQKIEVVGIDTEKDILLVRGSVPGAKRGLLTIHKSKKGK